MVRCEHLEVLKVFSNSVGQNKCSAVRHTYNSKKEEQVLHAAVHLMNLYKTLPSNSLTLSTSKYLSVEDSTLMLIQPTLLLF